VERLPWKGALHTIPRIVYLTRIVGIATSTEDDCNKYLLKIKVTKKEPCFIFLKENNGVLKLKTDLFVEFGIRWGIRAP
jgi:hypothetical protein